MRSVFRTPLPCCSHRDRCRFFLSRAPTSLDWKAFRPLCEQVILATCCVMSVFVTHMIWYLFILRSLLLLVQSPLMRLKLSQNLSH